jgi:hypothetical protein
MRVVTSITLLVVAASEAAAQQKVYNLTPNTIFRSMQCEIGLAAKNVALLRGRGIKTYIKYTTSGSQELKAKAEAGFPNLLAIIKGPKLGVGYSIKKVDGNTLEGKLNIDTGNTDACVGARKNAPAVPLGIYECLHNGSEAIVGSFGNSCTKSVTMMANFDASGQFKFWVITIGGTSGWGYTLTYTIETKAPAP